MIKIMKLIINIISFLGGKVHRNIDIKKAAGYPTALEFFFYER